MSAKTGNVNAEPVPASDGGALMDEIVRLKEEVERLERNIEMMEEQREEAVQIAADAYRAVWRDGWEPGKTKNEAFDRLHAWLCDEGHDPNDEVSK